MYLIDKILFNNFHDFQCQINALRAKRYYIVQILEFKDETINNKGTATILYEQR